MTEEVVSDNYEMPPQGLVWAWFWYNPDETTLWLRDATNFTSTEEALRFLDGLADGRQPHAVQVIFPALDARVIDGVELKALLEEGEWLWDWWERPFRMPESSAE